ncbi:hypothetical protein GCM10023189_32990 [Nibrella saemangeumensis]|uniref:Lipocalin-like domain-containing protein n=1 Tax=Nibrella saemangeumensis TaxID=1084526 RepID=A0ABP8N0T3_9BACT
MTRILFTLVLFLLVGGFTTRNQLVSAPRLAPECFAGKWGNDFLLCGTEHTAKPGRGLAATRQQQELVLFFQGPNKGYFHFYDCQNQRYTPKTMPFTFTTSGSQFTLNWQGTPYEVALFRATFNNRDTYQFECKADTLVFDKSMFTGTQYEGAYYFVRRN